jgi:hypothetical protein
MKKKVLGLLGAAVIVFFVSCQTRLFVWDESYPPERLAYVNFVNMTVTAYNGITVNNFARVKIPSGQTDITADVRIQHAGITFIARDMEFGFPFQAGRDYRVVGRTSDRLWGVAIYDDNTNEQLMFVSFIIQPQF